MVSPEGIDAVKPSPKGEGAPLIPPGEPRRDECRGVVSRIFVSWNQISEWLRRLNELQEVA